MRAAVRSSAGMVYSDAVQVVVWHPPVPPAVISPAGGYAAAKANLVLKARADTTQLVVRLNGAEIGRRAVLPEQVVNFGTLNFSRSSNTLEVIASNPVASTSANFNIRRLDYPWPTGVVIDKSDFRLYWIKNGRLVKAYPIAHGKASTPTPVRIWRIDAKYHTDPSSVYGPRKMRLFKKAGSSYAYTAYAIHGTNQPWVIGTRASAGCIRMYNSDVLELFPQVPLGTMVQTRE